MSKLSGFGNQVGGLDYRNKSDNDNGHIKPKKSFGQNFLKSEHHLEQIATAIKQLSHDDPVIEFGAGLGALTQVLLANDLVVHAVERDRDLIPILREKFAEPIRNSRLILHEADAVRFDYLPLLGDRKTVFCGNLPYHLTSSIIFKTMEAWSNLHGAVYLLQKEVAERIACGPDSKVYGLLSVLVQARFHPRVAFDVPRTAFWPAPKVDSAVLVLEPKTHAPIENWAQLVTLVKLAFAQRRKTLGRALISIPSIKEKLNSAQIDSQLRAENLSVDDFIRLSKFL